MHHKSRLRGTLAALACAIAAPTVQAANLFVANFNNNTTSEVTPSGAVTTFATGFSDPLGLAFNASGDLFVANGGNSTISEVTPSSVVTTFATGFSEPVGRAFQPVPEPSSLFLATVAALTLLGYGRWRRRAVAVAG